MTDALRTPMSRDAFFAWADRQEGRYEFDGLQPVAMVGGTVGHSLITGNLLRALGSRLAGTGCRALGPDAGIVTVGDSVRYPDVVVTCSTLRLEDRLVANPVVVFEVISPTSIRTDRVTKLLEYQAVQSIRRYVIVEATAMALTVYVRDATGEPFRAGGPTDPVELPELNIAVPMSEIYDGLGLETD